MYSTIHCTSVQTVLYAGHGQPLLVVDVANSLFTMTLNEAGQVYNCGTSCMREDGETSKEENQAAAPASKAPRAQ